MAIPITPEAQRLVGKRIHVTKAQRGHEYVFSHPGINLITPEKLYLGTLEDYQLHPSMLARATMSIRIRVDPSFVKKWGLAHPLLEWQETPETFPIFELKTPDTSDLARTLVKMNKDQPEESRLPPELLSVVWQAMGQRKPKGYPRGAFGPQKQPLRTGDFFYIRPEDTGTPIVVKIGALTALPGTTPMRHAESTVVEGDATYRTGSRLPFDYAPDTLFVPWRPPQRPKGEQAVKEDQERRTKEQEEMIASLSPEEREAATAMRGGRRR